MVSGVAVAKTSILRTSCSRTMSPSGLCTTFPLIVMFGELTMPELVESPAIE